MKKRGFFSYVKGIFSPEEKFKYLKTSEHRKPKYTGAGERYTMIRGTMGDIMGSQAKELSTYKGLLDNKKINPKQYFELVKEAHKEYKKTLIPLEGILAKIAAIVFLMISMLFLNLSTNLGPTGAVIVDLSGQSIVNIPLIIGILFLVLSIILFVRKKN